MEKICIVKRRKRDYGVVSTPASQTDSDVVSVELTDGQADLVLQSNAWFEHLLREGKTPQVFFNLHFKNAFPFKMLKTREVSEILQVSSSTVERLVKTGAIKAYRIGRVKRFSMEDVMEYLSAVCEAEGLNTFSANITVKAKENAEHY